MSSPPVRSPDAPTSDGPDFWPGIVFTVALLGRFAYFAAYANSPFWNVQFADQSYYRNWGMAIAAGDWLGKNAFEQGPLYAYLLGTAFRLGANDGFIIGLQLLAGATISLLAFACARRLFDRPTALAAGLLAATYGPFIHAECMLMKSFLSPLLTMLAMYSTLRFGDAGRRIWIVLAGAAVGLACLVTENHLLLLLPIGFQLGWSNPLRTATAAETSNNSLRSPRIASLLLLAGSCAAMILPATIRNIAVAGEMVAVTAGGGEVFYMAWGPSATGNYEPPPFVRSNPYLEHEDFRREARRRTGLELNHSESSRYWFRQGLAEVVADPGRSLALAAKKAVGLFNDFEVPDSEHYQVSRELIPLLYVLPSFGWIAGVGFVGLGICLREFRKYQLPIGLFAMHVLSVILTYNFGRFRLGMTSIWMLFAAAGGTWLICAWRSRESSSQKFIATALVVAITAAAWLPSPSVDKTALESETQKFREALATLAKLNTETTELLRQLPEHSNDAARQFEIGDRFLQQGKFYEAIRYLTEAVQLDGNNPKFRSRLAEVQQAEGRFDAAIDELEAVFQAHPGSPELENALMQLASRRADLPARDWLRLAAMLEAVGDASARAGKYEAAARQAGAAMISAQEAKSLELRDRLNRKYETYKAGRPLE